ncbi:MAG: aminotransferase class V-fold PLP-dependent enzyme, partial [Planctomycetia bacterium]|nr:aminotransferase class V-fold PLP-dependent enzyme [Planctomycetia bacterium]
MIYLDNAATSFPKPEQVYTAMDTFARTSLANPGRAGHKMALASEHALDDARHRLNRFLNGKAPERFAFALNCTDALNMAFKGVLERGDHVVTTDLEHNSVSRPLVTMAEAGFIELSRISSDGGGTVDPDAIAKAITPKTKMVAATHASNVLGTVQPVAEIGRICKERGVLFLVDAAQTIGAVPIDVQAMHIDLLAFPGHKCLFGPTGTGALYVASGVAIKPWREGGTGGDSSTPTQPKEFPYWLEGGTPNVLGIVGMIAGL